MHHIFAPDARGSLKPARYAAAVNATDLAFAGAAAQARMLADGEVTAPALLEMYLGRIARLDTQLRCYRVVLVDQARAEAAAAQDRLDAGERLPLLGCRSPSKTMSTSPAR